MPAVRENPDKWARNSGTAGPSFLEGTANPRRPWEESAIAGEANFATSMGVVISEERRAKGIAKSGQRRYDEGIKEKGVLRYRQAVALPSSKARYKTGFDPFADAIRAVDLPPRQPKGQNIERVRVIQDALIAEKARQLA